MVAYSDKPTLDTRPKRQAPRAVTHGGVGALLTLGLCSELFTATQAHADILDSILDPVISPPADAGVAAGTALDLADVASSASALPADSLGNVDAALVSAFETNF